PRTAQGNLPGASLTRGWKEAQSEFETWRVINHFDPRAVKSGNGGDQAEAETIPRCVTVLFQPVEALEDMLMFLGGNSRPVIGNRDHRLTVNAFVADNDPPSRAAMLDRIV